MVIIGSMKRDRLSVFTVSDRGRYHYLEVLFPLTDKDSKNLKRKE